MLDNIPRVPFPGLNVFADARLCSLSTGMLPSFGQLDDTLIFQSFVRSCVIAYNVSSGFERPLF